MGAKVYVHGPLFSDAGIRAHPLEPPPSWPLRCDALAVQAWHLQYASLDFASFPGLRAVLGGRAALDPAAIAKAGVIYLCRDRAVIPILIGDDGVVLDDWFAGGSDNDQPRCRYDDDLLPNSH